MQSRGKDLKEFLDEVKPDISRYQIITQSVEVMISGLDGTINLTRVFCLVSLRGPIVGLIFMNPYTGERLDLGVTRNPYSRRQSDKVIKNGLVFCVRPGKDFIVKVKVFTNGDLQATGKMRNKAEKMKVFRIVVRELERLQNRFGIIEGGISRRVSLGMGKMRIHLINIMFKCGFKINLRNLEKLLDTSKYQEFRTIKKLENQLVKMQYRGKCRISIYSTGSVLINSLKSMEDVAEVYEFMKGFLGEVCRDVVKIPDSYLDLDKTLVVSDDEVFPDSDVDSDVDLEGWR